MNWLVTAYHRLTRELFPFEQALSPGEHIFFRLFEAIVGAWTLEFLWGWAATISRLKTVVLPLGIANYVNVEIFFGHGLAYGVAGLGTVLLVLGYFRKWDLAYVGVLLAFHLQYVCRYSLGEISHGSHFPGLATLGFALATWLFAGTGDKLARFVYGFLFFVFGVAYSCAGVCKLVATGISWPAGQHLVLWMGERSIDVTSTFGSFEMNVLQTLALDYPALGTAALTFGLVAELAGLAMCFRRARPYVLTALIVMHLGVEVTLNIFFGHNVYVLALLAYPWGKAIDWLLRLRGGRPTGLQHA